MWERIKNLCQNGYDARSAIAAAGVPQKDIAKYKYYLQVWMLHLIGYRDNEISVKLHKGRSTVCRTRKILGICAPTGRPPRGKNNISSAKTLQNLSNDDNAVAKLADILDVSQQIADKMLYALHARRQGATEEEIAGVVGVHRSTVSRWLKKMDAAGKKMGMSVNADMAKYYNYLRSHMKQKNDGACIYIGDDKSSFLPRTIRVVHHVVNVNAKKHHM